MYWQVVLWVVRVGVTVLEAKIMAGWEEVYDIPVNFMIKFEMSNNGMTYKVKRERLWNKSFYINTQDVQTNRGPHTPGDAQKNI